ncbi:MAG: cation-translocating P-type ATPase [Chitinophagaceae bacterium]|nr:cation-translocating P-type ATPase [Chitinophagaceae bacterium]
MPSINFNISGLSNEQVLLARKNYGNNRLHYKKESGIYHAIRSIAKEPMVILLLLASVVYFISGNTGDGIFLAAAIVLVATISLFQDSRSRNALDKLKNFTEPNCKVIRSSKVEEIKTEELVMGDSVMVEEGTTIPADCVIVHSNDFSVNESILTGESMSVYKDPLKADHVIYRGTTVSSGLAIATVTAIGNETRLGKIGKSLESIKEEKTPLEFQIGDFVKKMVIAGAIVFAIVWAINFYRTADALDSLLRALTLAMSILPEEIPVAFTTFMALGAWRLMKIGIVVKQMKTVETLGSATVICTDKTGTITENRMSLARIFVLTTQKISYPETILDREAKELVRLAMWASEPIPFDPMEIALHEAYSKAFLQDERSSYSMRHEYPLSGKPPMMTHIFEDLSGNRIIAAKGAPEAMMKVSALTADEKLQIETALKTLATDGFRVLGVGVAKFKGDQFPLTQQEFHFQFKGIVAFYDPPKPQIEKVLRDFYAAGISVKIITGDNDVTTAAIAKQIGLKGFEKNLSGDALIKMTEGELEEVVGDINLFTRMFPDAKLKVINALKARHEIVAMTGDGVNDGPALKAAHIGIAMGKKGTEIAKEAASLILVEDDLSRMVDAVAMGRRIYTNLKKAIQYIISIHIPIVLTVFIPLALGWIYPNIFSPIHIIFMELIMGPTCSIIYENEPIEKNTMHQKPRSFTTTFFNWSELTTSIIQGLMITVGTLLVYQYAAYSGYNESLTRTMVFTVLIAANVFLTLINRSFYYSMFTTFRYHNNLVLLIISITIIIAGLLLYIKPLADFFGFEFLNLNLLFLSIGTGFLSVAWYELVKWKKRMMDRNVINA